MKGGLLPPHRVLFAGAIAGRHRLASSPPRVAGFQLPSPVEIFDRCFPSHAQPPCDVASRRRVQRVSTPLPYYRQRMSPPAATSGGGQRLPPAMCLLQRLPLPASHAVATAAAVFGGQHLRFPDRRFRRRYSRCPCRVRHRSDPVQCFRTSVVFPAIEPCGVSLFGLLSCSRTVLRPADLYRVRLRATRASYAFGGHLSTIRDRDDSISSLIHSRAPPWARVRSRTRYLFILLLFCYYLDNHTFVGFASSTEVPETGGNPVAGYRYS
ncbi:uncharacterized protein LOC122001139 isoform X1 [Zingiber officinale]|uniref:uncharacterized protein LOC122001139 isoform X1 n=1 Tax=Zingiber officinale TaxID=94328 RepID=UPI001C4C5B9E|nr:uncharacterized protein LOC122001139 isoform X1 [Zingiber officinale]